MSGTSLTLNSESLKRFKQALNDIKSVALKREFWDSLGAIGESQIRNNLANLKIDPDTKTPWKALDEDYAAKKSQTSSGGILEFEGNLIDSISFESTDDGVDIGTNIIYAAAHQFGFDDKGIEARPFMGFTDFDELETTVLNWLQEAA